MKLASEQQIQKSVSPEILRWLKYNRCGERFLNIMKTDNFFSMLEGVYNIKFIPLSMTVSWGDQTIICWMHKTSLIVLWMTWLKMRCYWLQPGWQKVIDGISENGYCLSKWYIKCRMPRLSVLVLTNVIKTAWYLEENWKNKMVTFRK